MIFLPSPSSLQQYVGGPLSVESYPIMDAVNDWMSEACKSELGTLIGQIPTERYFVALFDCSFTGTLHLYCVLTLLQTTTPSLQKPTVILLTFVLFLSRINSRSTT